MFDKIVANINKGSKRFAESLRVHKSDIFVAGGAVAVVAGVIFCCKATLECDEILDEHSSEMDKIHKAAAKDEAYAKVGVPRDTAKVYGRTCWKIFRRFALGAGLVGGGLYFMAKGYGIVKDEKSKLIVAYNSLLAAYNSEIAKKENDYIELDNGDRMPVIKTDGDIVTVDMNPDDYIIPFGRGNNNFHSDTRYGATNDFWNYNFLNFTHHEMKRILYEEKSLYFIDALEMLGVQKKDIPNEHLARVAGWIDDRFKDDGEVMNDYKFFTIIKDESHPEGLGDTIWLRFNVDGIILGRDV